MAVFQFEPFMAKEPHVSELGLEEGSIYWQSTEAIQVGFECHKMIGRPTMEFGDSVMLGICNCAPGNTVLTGKPTHNADGDLIFETTGFPLVLCENIVVPQFLTYTLSTSFTVTSFTPGNPVHVFRLVHLDIGDPTLDLHWTKPPAPSFTVEHHSCLNTRGTLRSGYRGLSGSRNMIDAVDYRIADRTVNLRVTVRALQAFDNTIFRLDTVIDWQHEIDDGVPLIDFGNIVLDEAIDLPGTGLSNVLSGQATVRASNGPATFAPQRNLAYFDADVPFENSTFFANGWRLV